MEKFYHIFGIISFWGLIVLLIYLAYVFLPYEIEIIRDERMRLKEEIKRGKYVKLPNGQMVRKFNDYILKDDEKEVSHKEFYIYSWYQKIYLIGIK